MRITDRYLGKQVLTGTLYAVIVLGVVLVLGNLFKEIKPLLVDQKAPLGLVLRFVINVLPMSLMYTIPWGFLSAVLLVFGRLSSGQEITALRVAGISLPRIALPVFVIGAGLSALSLWLNITVVPQSKATVVELLYEQAARDPDSLLKPGIIQGNFKGGDGMQKALIEGKSGGWVTGFHFYQIPGNPNQPVSYVHADRAALAVDAEKNQLRAKLEGAYFETRDEKGRIEMGFAGRAEPLLIDLRDPRRRRMKASAMTNAQLRIAAAAPDIDEKYRMRFRSEIAKRYAFSLASFAFAFVAVPLGLGKRRRDSSGGLVLSLGIGAAYFIITIVSEQFHSETAAGLMIWLPNILCVVLGLVLFRRARFR
ncbi:MAG: LptF/LptG family permease [Verrucomicrobiota bacterium]